MCKVLCLGLLTFSVNTTALIESRTDTANKEMTTQHEAHKSVDVVSAAFEGSFVQNRKLAPIPTLSRYISTRQ